MPDGLMISADGGTGAVRYVYAATHPWANLFNADRLPALAFRTDDW